MELLIGRKLRRNYVILEQCGSHLFSLQRRSMGAPICNTVLQHFSCNMVDAIRNTPQETLEVLSFSALFGTGCCCQLVCFVCFECSVLHFRLPLYTRNGQVGEHVLFLLWFLVLVLAGCCCKLVCFECCVSFPFANTRNGQIVEHVRTEKKQKRPCPAVQGTWLHVGPFLAGVLTQRFSTQPLELYIPRLSRCTAQ